MNAQQFSVGQMVMTSTPNRPDYALDCAMVIAAIHGYGERTHYHGWFYKVDTQPDEAWWYLETALRELSPPGKDVVNNARKRSKP